ncbi:MAG TPA: S41 family peptidase, partial [Puia sp.]|nr:S41 family peptidase [Puia sp.]
SFFFSTIFQTCECQGEVHYNQKIAPPLLRLDFLLLRDTLERSHPGLYRYRSKKDMDYVFDSCYSSIRDSETVMEFFTRVAYIVASIGDGHTNCNPPRPVLQEFMNSEKFFPALPIFIHSQAYVYCCNQSPEINGSEILSINDVPMGQVLQKIYGYVQSDAFITSHKDTELPDGFIFLYYLIFGHPDKFEVSCQAANGEIKKATLKPDTFKGILCPPPFTRPTRYLELNYKKGDIAVITIKSFFNGFLQQTHENFEAFLDSSFSDIKKRRVEKLLIDIRRNQGGNDNNGELLYSYLTAKPFRYYLSQETTTQKFTEKDQPNLAIQQPQANNYAGRLYVLADGRSFSASAEFSSVVKSNDRGKFIGDVCGGGYYGNTSGDEVHVILPNSHLDIRLPLVKYTVAVRNIGENVWSIKPDYPLYPTISDLIEKKDGELDRAVEIVRNH